jgi:integrase
LIDLLQALPRVDAEYVFPVSDNAMKRLLWRMGYDPEDVTVHGFRTTFKTWAAAATNYPDEVSEKALAHKNKSKVQRTYQRDDLLEKRSCLMADWANYCATPRADATVLPMRRAG